MKKLSAVILALIMLAACFAGCGEKAPADTAEEPVIEAHGVYHTYLPKALPTLNAMINSDTPCGEIGGWTRAGLYSTRPVKDGTAWEWWLNIASDWPQKMDEEGKVWRVSLRDDVKWENGDTLNIDDYIYSMQMLADPIQKNPTSTGITSSAYGKVVNMREYRDGECTWEDVGVKKIDDYTVEFTFEFGVPQINVQRFANTPMIVYKPLYEAGMNEDRSATNYGTSAETYISFGPFKLVEWIPDAKLTLVRNEYYPHQEMYHLEGVDFRIIIDGETALQLFLKGELDYCLLNYTDWEQFEDDPRVYEYFDDSQMFMFVNLGNPSQNNILGCLDYRRALYHGVDRIEIADTMGVYPVARFIRRCVEGNAITGQLYVDIPQDYVPDVTTLYDPPLAREYLAKAFEEKGLSSAALELLQAESATFNKAANEMIQKQYDKVFEGKLKVSIRQVPSTIKLRRWDPENPTSYEASIGGLLATVNDPRPHFRFYTSYYNPPRIKWDKPEYDALYDEAMRLDLYDEDDAQKIIELCQKMEKMALDDLIVIPLYEKQNKVIFSERVQLPVKDYISGYGFGMTLMRIVD